MALNYRREMRMLNGGMKNIRAAMGGVNAAMGGVLRVVSLTLALAAPTLEAKEPWVSLRVIENGGEVEAHWGQVGVGAARIKVEVQDLFCGFKGDQTFGFVRYFFKPLQSTWYLGLLYFKHNYQFTAPCEHPPPDRGVIAIVGYHWLLQPGVSIDLGLRPGILALGLSF